MAVLSLRKIYLALRSMKHHTSSETWLLQKGLEYNGWRLIYGPIDVSTIGQPDLCIVSDHREWDERSFQHGKEQFINLNAIKCPKISILKDVQWCDGHQRGYDHLITYYHTASAMSGIPEDRLIRTYHCIDKDQCPEFNEENPGYRDGCLLSGADSELYYPLRHRLIKAAGPRLPWHTLQHPGYQDKKSYSNEYLKLLSKYKVAICTASIYDYALRKIIEATACGCKVITNLTEVLPRIDDNLIKVPNNCTVERMVGVVNDAIATYDTAKQVVFANAAREYYDYRSIYKTLDADIVSRILHKGP